MMSNKLKEFKYLIIILVFLSSCLNIKNEAKSWITNDNTEFVSGKYHFLDDTGTKIYLPSKFERYSLSKYQSLIDSLLPKKEYRFEVNKLNALSKMEGSLYLFYDESTKSTYTINTMPYFAFSKESVPQLLKLIQSSNTKIAKSNDATFKKIKATFGGNYKQQLFKTVYKINRKKIKDSIFNSSYIISSNGKTVFIQITTALEVDFDPFIEKMIF